MDSTGRFTAEIEQALAGGSPRPGCGCVNVDCPWRRELIKVKQDHELYRQRMQFETNSQISGMEERLIVMRNEAEHLKHTLEAENRDLRRVKAVLERENKSLKEELEQTRVTVHESATHTQQVKRLMHRKCGELEKRADDKGKEVMDLSMQLNQYKCRTQALERELRSHADRSEQYHQTMVEMRRRYEGDLHKLLRDSEKQFGGLEEYYNRRLEDTEARIAEFNRQVKTRDEAINQLIMQENSRENEFKITAENMQKMIRNTLRENREAMEKLETELLLVQSSKKDREEEVAKAMRMLEKLNAYMLKYQRETDQYCRQTLAIIGTSESLTDLELLHKGRDINANVTTTDCTEADEDDDSGSPECRDTSSESDPQEREARAAEAERQAAKEAEMELKLQNATVKTVMNAVKEWKQTVEDQKKQLRQRIKELEESLSSERMMRIQESGAANEKLKVYKKLIVKLRNKLELLTEAGTGITDVPSKSGKYSVQQRRPSSHARCAATFQPSDTDTSESASHVSASNIKAKFNCNEFKFLLDRAEHLLKCIEESEVPVSTAPGTATTATTDQ